jgi:hypothetical protein
MASDGDGKSDPQPSPRTALRFLIPGRHRIGGSIIDLATAAPSAG